VRRGGAGRRVPGDVRARIEHGNAAYRAGDYPAALAHYREATRLEPDEATGWYGVVMAADALGNARLAAEARERVRALNPALDVGGHPAPGSHPPVTAPSPHPPRPADSARDRSL
jgi:tetratricopeptide (TPR) repeat protein